MTAKKTQQGECITNVVDLLAWLRKDYYVYNRGRPIHPGWLVSLQFRYLIGEIRSGRIYKCLDLEGNPYKSRRCL